MSVYLDRVQAFSGPPVTDPRKVQRCKLLEEAAEAFVESQRLEYFDGNYNNLSQKVRWHLKPLADELADTIQAAVNLAAIHGIAPEELDAAMRRCFERNHERGRV